MIDLEPVQQYLDRHYQGNEREVLGQAHRAILDCIAAYQKFEPNRLFWDNGRMPEPLIVSFGFGVQHDHIHRAIKRTHDDIVSVAMTHEHAGAAGLGSGDWVPADRLVDMPDRYFDKKVVLVDLPSYWSREPIDYLRTRFVQRSSEHRPRYVLVLG